MSSDPKKSKPKAMDETQPKAEWSAAPIALIVLLALLIYWGMVFLNNHGGGFNAKVYSPFASFKDVEDAQPVTEGGEVLKRGRLVFTANCAPCHQVHGNGTPGQYPPLAGSEWVLAPKSDRIIRIVLNGLQGHVEVKGEAYNAAMVPWRDVLKGDEGDKDIAAVITFIRQEWGNKAGPVKPEEVKAIRDATADKTDAWTAEELKQVPDR